MNIRCQEEERHRFLLHFLLILFIISGIIILLQIRKAIKNIYKSEIIISRGKTKNQKTYQVNHFERGLWISNFSFLSKCLWNKKIKHTFTNRILIISGGGDYILLKG